MKENVGSRFCRFRRSISKTQSQLAEELGIYQSTIASFEMGKTFPNFKYLYHFHKKHGLNINWLLTGDGNMFMNKYKIEASALPLGEKVHRYNPNNAKKHAELLTLMEIPVVEEVIMAKLLELKILLKDEVEMLYLSKKNNGNQTKESDNGDDIQ